MRLLLLVTSLCFTAAREFEDKLDRYIIACRSSDFECFRRQYKSLRDNVLMGNQRLGVSLYEHYTFKYGESGTCIRLAGLEQSELTGIHLENDNREFSWTLELPFTIHQILNYSARCVKPDNEFVKIGEHRGILKKFTGNATIQVTYPYTLRKKKGEVHMVLGDENLDVILDIPDLSNFNKESSFEHNLYELSEWAYSVVQHIDAAQNFALPYTSHFRTVAEVLPMRRFFTLYPEEEYADLRFKYTKQHTKCIANL